MANTDDLRRLAEEMAVAYEERVNSIVGIKTDTANLLRAFSVAHQEMADQLRTELAKVKPELDAAESERKAADQAEIKERGDYIEKLLADFDKAHAEMAKELRAELAKVKPELNAAESERKAADQAEIKERGDYIEKLLADFDKAHAEMAKELRAELAKVKPELDAAESERKAADQAEIRETAAAWKGLLSAMQAARGRTVVAGPVEVEAEVAVKTVEEAIEAPIEEVEAIEAPIEEVEAIEEAAEEEEIEEKETEKLEDRVLDILHDKPEGLKMAQIADMLGIENWRTLIPIMRGLLNDEEIRKEGTLYFLSE